MQKEREKEKAKLTCNPIDSINRNKISSVTFTNTKRFDYSKYFLILTYNLEANEDSRPVLEPNYTNIRNKVPVMLFGKGIRFKKVDKYIYIYIYILDSSNKYEFGYTH